jgi:hypothetical protein
VLEAKLATIEAAVRVLDLANICYSHQIPGKLVVPPPEGVAGLTVTFWPARECLRIQRRPTKREQDLRAFEQALVAQGHQIAGHSPRRPEADSMPSFEHALARQQHLFLQRAADLTAMEQAYEELAALHRQRLEDLAHLEFFAPWSRQHGAIVMSRPEKPVTRA